MKRSLKTSPANFFNGLPAVVLFTVIALQPFAASGQTALTGCAAKRDSITQEIQKSQGDANRTAGLEKALDEVNANCRDTTLEKRRNRKIIDAQIRVNETERALRLAETKHKPEDKLAKLRKKYDDAKSKLAAAEAELTK